MTFGETDTDSDWDTGVNQKCTYFLKKIQILLITAFQVKLKKAIAVDTKKEYKEIMLGRKKSGSYTFEAPYVSDWAIVVE